MSKLKNFSYLTVLGAASLATVGCNKYEDGPNFSLRTKKARIVGGWNVESIGSEVLGSTYSINMSFEKTGSLTYTESYTYGGYSDSYSYAGSWEFASDKEEIRLNLDGDIQVFEIKRLTNKEVWLDDDVTSADGNIWKLEAK
jgi:hypothetical protein